MIAWGSSCCHGIHSDRNTPNSRIPPGINTRISECGSDRNIVSEPREVTRIASHPSFHSDHHESHIHRDYTLDDRSDSHMNGRSDHYRRIRAPDSNSNLKNVHVIVSGKVQGVFYRKWTVENARKLCPNGWVRNCKDGAVEAVFSGKLSAVDLILGKCKTGPVRARVANVKVTMADGPPKKGFIKLDDRRW